jgi:hypothetical protein
MLSSPLCTKKSVLLAGIDYTGDVLIGAVLSGDWKWVEEVLYCYCHHLKSSDVEYLISKGLTKGGHDQCIIAQGVFVRRAMNFPYESVPYGVLDEIETHLRACAFDYITPRAPVIFASNRPEVMDLYLHIAKSTTAFKFTHFMHQQIKLCVVLYDFDVFLKLYETGGIEFFPQWLEQVYLGGRLDIVRYIVESRPLLNRRHEWFPLDAHCPNARLRQYLEDNFTLDDDNDNRFFKKLRYKN